MLDIIFWGPKGYILHMVSPKMYRKSHITLLYLTLLIPRHHLFNFSFLICCQVSILESTQSCRVMLHFTFHTLHAKLRTCQYLIDKNHFRTNYFAIVEITKVTTEGSNGYNSRNIWF